MSIHTHIFAHRATYINPDIFSCSIKTEVIVVIQSVLWQSEQFLTFKLPNLVRNLRHWLSKLPEVGQGQAGQCGLVGEARSLWPQVEGEGWGWGQILMKHRKCQGGGHTEKVRSWALPLIIRVTFCCDHHSSKLKRNSPLKMALLWSYGLPPYYSVAFPSKVV